MNLEDFGQRGQAAQAAVDKLTEAFDEGRRAARAVKPGGLRPDNPYHTMDNLDGKAPYAWQRGFDHARAEHEPLKATGGE